MHRHSIGLRTSFFRVGLLAIIGGMAISACSAVPTSTTIVLTPALTPDGAPGLGMPTQPALLPSPTNVPPTDAVPTQVPTPDPTAVVATLEALRAPTDVETRPSPDGQWVAEFVHQGCVEVAGNGVMYNRFRILNAAGQEVSRILEETSNCGVGGGSYDLRAWSPDSRYLYIGSSLIPDGAACFSNISRNVIRIEAATGQAQVLPGEGPVSPDGSQMAWRDGRDLALWNMNTGEITRLVAVFPDVPVVYVVWALDGGGIYFVQNEMDCLPYGKSAIGWIRLADQQVQTLIESSDPVLVGIKAIETNRLVLNDNQGGTWSLDLQTGTLSQ